MIQLLCLTVLHAQLAQGLLPPAVGAGFKHGAVCAQSKVHDKASTSDEEKSNPFALGVQHAQGEGAAKLQRLNLEDVGGRERAEGKGRAVGCDGLAILLCNVSHLQRWLFVNLKSELGGDCIGERLGGAGRDGVERCLKLAIEAEGILVPRVVLDFNRSGRAAS